MWDHARGKMRDEDTAEGKLDPGSRTKLKTGYVVGHAIKAEKIRRTGMVTVGKDA